MRIFGRKANQRSTTPSAPNVPPELQPYYGRPSLGTRLRRIGMFVLPVIAALALIAALVAGGMWLKHRADDTNHKVATSQSTAQKPTTSNQSQSGGKSQSQNQGSSQNQPTDSQAANNSSNNTYSSNNSATQPSGPSGQPAAGSQSSPANIPSTGPDASMYMLALIMASVATVAAYMHQLKTARR